MRANVLTFVAIAVAVFFVVGAWRYGYGGLALLFVVILGTSSYLFFRKRTVPLPTGHAAWRMPMYSAFAAVVVFLPLLISENTDVLYLFLIVPILAIISICVLIAAAVGRDLRLALAVATFCAVSAVAFLYSFQIRTFTRWTLLSSYYKHEVLAEPSPVNGELKHIEWDSWGFAEMDSTVFLVFDPTDSLGEAAQKHQYGKFKGIPCDVDWVRRMDSHWYLVFSEVYSWQSCETASSS